MTWGRSLLGVWGCGLPRHFVPRNDDGGGRWRGRMPHVLCCLVMLVLGVAYANDVTPISDVKQVTVRQQRLVDGAITSLADDAYTATDTAFTTVVAPSIAGYRFVYWRSEPAQPDFTIRDIWGRAYEQVSVVPKDEVVTLTAVYEPEGEEAEKLYWYGGSAIAMDSDTDGDGYTFAQELQYGMNPHFPNSLKLGGVTYGDSNTLLYNPNEYQPYTIKSNPEGALFATEIHYVSPGTVVTTSSYTPTTSNFAYWTVEGVRQADVFGVALNAVTFTMPAHALEVVAHCVDDEFARQSLYWYGRELSADEDTDGDGYTFAQELQYGMNPHFPNTLKLGGVTYGDSNLLLYNPNEYSPYTIQAEPATVFAEITGYLKPGETKATASYANDTTFAYWTLNGVRQADAFGRAWDSVTLTGTGAMDGGQVAVAHFASETMTEEQRAIAYWYGPESNVTMASDTDGDGYTLAQELQYGMNPLFKNELVLGGVTYGDGPTLETNLQPFDFGEKALVGGRLESLFATLNPATGNWEGGLPLQGQVSVAILDVNGDELFDFLIHSQAGLVLYQNNGTPGSADFQVVVNPYPALAEALAAMTRPLFCRGNGQVAICDNGGSIFIYDFATGTLTVTEMSGYPLWNGEAFITLADLTLNVAVEPVMSAALQDVTGDDVLDLLIADADGRISLYTLSDGVYTLQHRVWGGSFVGFAEGLTLAPVDWDGDGDEDVVCGTSDGKLILLRDPGVGRPTNLRATAGYDNVVLNWDPNGQSKVYGYKAYRATSPADEFANIAETALPTYRDVPPSISRWAYYVTALSRLWTAGNSKPDTFESVRSNIVSVDLGGVELSMPAEMTSYDNADIAVPIRINNSMAIAAKDLSLTVTYDETKLMPLRLETSALTEGLALTSNPANGTWSITSTGGAVAVGSGALFTLHFSIPKGVKGEATIALTAATLYSLEGNEIGHNTLPITTRLTIQERAKPAVVTLRLTDVAAQTGDIVTLPLEIETTQPLDWETLALSISYDATKLKPVGEPIDPTEASPRTNLQFEVLEQHGENLFADVTVSGTAMSANGLAAIVHSATCHITIIDSAAPRVTLLAPATVSAETRQTFTVDVAVSSIGVLDWETVTLTATFKEGGRLTQTSVTPPTATAPVATFTFAVTELHGVNLAEEITFTATAKGTNGKDAAVTPATTRVTIIDGDPAKVTLSAPAMLAAETLTTHEIVVSATSVGEVDWSTFQVSATSSAEWVTVVPKAASAQVVFEVAIPSYRGPYEPIILSFVGEAKGVNGLDAVVAPISTVLTITDGEPPILTVTTENKEGVPTLSDITLPVHISSEGELDWDSVAITAAFDTSKLELVGEAVRKGVTQNYGMTFKVRELHDNLSDVIIFTVSAKGVNGKVASPVTVTATLTFIDSTPPKDPTDVEPWTNGDVDGDGKLTKADIEKAFKALNEYHRPTVMQPSPHSSDPTAEDWLIHQSILQALGKSADDKLKLERDSAAFANYITSKIEEKGGAQ